MANLSRADIAALIRDNPDATEAELVQLARSRNASPWVGLKNKARSWWETANRPLVDLPINATSTPGKFGEAMLEGLTSPLGLASMFTGLGAAGAAAKGLMGLSRAGALAEMGLNAPALGHGVYTAATGETPGMKGAGALEALLSTIGLRSGGKVLQQAARARKSVPEILALTRQGGGASVHPTQGNLAGQPLVSVGGVVPGEVHPGAALDEDLLNQFVNRKARALKDDRFLGTWNNPKDSKLYLDVSEAVPRAEGIRRGLARGEKAVFDLQNFEDINMNELPAADMQALIDDLLGPQRMLSEQSAVRGVPRLLTDEAGAVGPNIKAKPPLAKSTRPDDQALAELLREPRPLGGAQREGRFTPPIRWQPGFKPRLTYAKTGGPEALLARLQLERANLGQLLGMPEVGKLMPSEGGIRTALARGSLGAGGEVSTVALPDFAAGVRQNVKRPLEEVLRVSERGGARLSPQTVKRLEAIRQYAEGTLDPREIDWTDPAWKQLFESPASADEFAGVFSALSPQVMVRPNMRDTMSNLFQHRMGIPDEQTFLPFGRRGTGFGIGLEHTKLGNLKRARAGQPIGSAFPAKTEELRQGLLGNPDALPWDMHISRAMGLASDEPGTPLQYFLMKNAWRKYAGDIGEEKGIFPLMAKIWSGQKHATAQHEPGFTELLRTIGTKEPDFLKGYTPRNEQEFFEALYRVNELLKMQAAPRYARQYANLTTPTLF